MTVPERVLWQAVAATVRDALSPALPAGAALDTAVQLAGLADWAAGRAGSPPADRAGPLAAALGVPAVDLPAALELASAALVAAVDDPTTAPKAAPVRAVLLEQAAEDAHDAAPLMATFAGHPARDAPPAPTAVPAAELAALQRRLAPELGGRVRSATVISGGHSRRMLRVDLDGLDPLVVRIEQGGTFGTDGTLEARVVQALAAAGLPAPRVRLVEPDRGALGQPFFVMDLVPGTSTVDDAVLEEFLRVLDGVHRDGPAAVSSVLGPVPDPEAAVQAQVDRWEAVYRAAVPCRVPLLDEGAAWLRRHLRPTGPVALVHGDPGPGNFLSRGGRIAALTDWEFVHLGDAAEDWSYFATLRSRRLRPAQEWYAVLERVVGVRHDDPTWHAWEAFNQFKGACANLTALRLFRDGVAPSPSLLAIGTAVHTRFLRRLAELTAPT